MEHKYGHSFLREGSSKSGWTTCLGARKDSMVLFYWILAMH